jgi:exosome complex RNA-binding protein Rrp42 (RNase PH superfamily)
MLIQEKYTRRLLENNLRSDGREPFQPRDCSARFLPRSGIATAYQGHLVFRIGATEVCIKTKVEITAPKAERPNEGIIFFKVDCLSCQGNSEENRKLSAETAKLLETVIVGSKALDP